MHPLSREGLSGRGENGGNWRWQDPWVTAVGSSFHRLLRKRQQPRSPKNATIPPALTHPHVPSGSPPASSFSMPGPSLSLPAAGYHHSGILCRHRNEVTWAPHPNHRAKVQSPEGWGQLCHPVCHLFRVTPPQEMPSPREAAWKGKLRQASGEVSHGLQSTARGCSTEAVQGDGVQELS